MIRRRVAALGLAAVAAAGAGAALSGWPAGAGMQSRDVPAGQLPRPVRPAFTVPRTTLQAPSRWRSRWAPLRSPAVARERPGVHAAVVARLSTTTPEGTTNIVRVLGHREDAAGAVWVRVALAVLPNGSTGWVPRRALGGYDTVSTQLVVDLERLTATLLDRGRTVFRAPVGVGLPRWPTPRGRFYIRNELTRYAGATYGPVAFGTSARSAHLTDWPDGGYIGIHGTDHPELIPGRISHGCVRLRNADILRLARLMPVGTPVTFR
jgi:lipoprotein-anchoring transpeptidase ErfK/SrfK